MKSKTFSQALQVLLFRPEKESSKKFANTAFKDNVGNLSWDFDNSYYFKHSCITAWKNCFYLVPIFNLRNKNSKYDDNDPDNNVIKIIWAMEINRKIWSFSGEVFGRIYSKQLRINGVVYETIPMFLIALFSTVNQVFH